MTGNSSKFFRKILKTGLVTASGAAIMLSSSGALGAAAARTTTAPGVNLGTGAGLDGGGVFVAGSTLQFTGIHNVVSANVNILAVDMNNNTTTAFVANHLSIGSIVDTSVLATGKISVSLNARTLTLTGNGTNAAGFPTFVAADNIYTALDSITFNGDPAGVVTVQSYNNVATTLSGDIISKVAGFGTLNLNTDTHIDGTIGATNSLATINVGASTATLGGAVIKATTTNLTNNASVLTFTNPVTVAGNIDNTGNVNNGVVNFNGAGNSVVTGTIGNTASLAAVNFKGAGAVAITGASNATTFTVGNIGAAVTATGLMTGNVAFTAGGTLTPNGGIAGNVNVSNGGIIAGGKNVTGDLILANGAGAVDVGDVVGAEVEVNAGGPLTIKTANNGIKFTGTAVAGTTINVVDDVASNVGDVNNDAANGAGIGILNFLGAGAANNIGANASLAAVHFKGAGAVAITGTSNATTFIVGDAGADVTATGLMTGKVEFTADGQLTLGNGITGAVTTAFNNEGTLIVTAGNVAAVGVGNSLKQVTFNNVGASNAGNIFATDVTVGNAGTDVTTGTVNGAIDFTAAGKLNASALVTGTAVFNADGQLTLGNGITGAVTTAANDKGTLIVTAGDVADIGVGAPLKQVTFNGASTLNGAIDAQTITINGAVTANVGAITGNVNITSGTLTTNKAIIGDLTVSGTGNLAGDAAVTTVQGTVTLQAGATGVVTIKNAVDAVAVAGGTLNLVTAVDNMTITGGTVNQTGKINGDLAVSGTGNLAGDAAATDVAGTVTLQAGATGAVTIHDALNAAVVTTEGGTLTLRKAAGGIKFTGAAVAGTIINVVDDVASNVGDVNNDAANGAGTGILNFLGAGTANNIGANASLAEVNFKGAGAVAITGTSNATTFTVGNAGADVTATGLMTGKVEFTADGQLTLGNGITGAVTTAANNTGKLIVTAGDVGGAIGTNGGDILNSVTFNGASNVTTIDATTVAIGAGGNVKTTGAVTANVNFTGNGQLTVGAGGITGAVTTAANNTGKLIVTAGDVGGAIGTNGVNILNSVTFNGASTLNGAIDAQTITINGAVTANVGAITGNVNITSGTLTTNQVITGDLAVSGGGNLAGDAATTDVTKTVTLQATAGNVVIKDATGNVAVAGGKLNLVNAAADMTITGGTVTQTGTIAGNLIVSNGGNLAGDAATTDVTGTVTLQFGAGVVTIRDALNAAAVSVGAGTLNLQNAKGGINFDLGAGPGTTVTVAVGGNVNDVQNTTGFDNIGILTFKGVGQAGIIGNANSLSEVNVGAGEVTIKGAVVKANAINLTTIGVVPGAASAILFADTAQVTGAILNTSGTDKRGIAIFQASAGDSSITGGVGLNGAALAGLFTKVDAGKVITLTGNVYTEKLVLDDTAGGNAVGTVEIAGNLTGDVTFGTDANGAGGILEFNGNAVDGAGDPIAYKFDGAIAANADKGTLNVNTTLLTATSATVTGLKKINIVNTKALAIDASNGDVTLPAVQTIAFAGADSGLGFTNTGNRDKAKIIFSGDFVPANDGQGRITFASADPNDIGGAVPKALTIISDNPANIRKIGTAAVGGKKFANLSVFDQVIVDKTIDLSGIAELDVINGANFVDQGATSAAIQTINIGADDGAGAGPATHTIDVSTAAAVNLLGDNVKFADAGSTFKLQNTVAGNKTVSLANNIVGGAGDGGIVELNADFAGDVSILTIDGGGGAGKSLGTAANKLQTLIFSGNGEIKLINKATFNAINLNLGVTAIELGDIVQHLEFSGDTTLTETGDIASVDFKGFNATINMDPGKNITGTVTNTGVATNNGTIEFKGTGSIGGNISGLAMLKVGAGAVELKTGGATKITEIQGTGTDTLTLPENFKLTGAINSTGGLAVKLNFKGGTNSISGVVGTAANPVGGITTAGTTTFTSAVNSKGPITTAGNTTFSNSLNNIGDVTTSGTTTFTGAFNNQGAVNTNGTTTFKNSFTNQGDITLANATNFEGTFINTGTLTTQGASSNNFAGAFTNTGAVILAPNSVNRFNQQITATSINASASTLVVNAGLPISGTNLTGSGTTITLGSNQLLLSAGTKATFTDQLTLNTNFDGTANTGGNILITGANSKMDLSGVTKLKLVISTTNFDVNNVNPNTKYTLILAQDGGSLTELSSADIIETTIGGQENQFLKWNLNPSSLVLSPSIVEDRDDIIEAETKDDPEDVKEIVNALKDVIPGSEADLFDNSVGLIIDNKEQRIKVYEGVGEAQNVVPSSDVVVTTTTAAITNTVVNAMGSLNSRMNSFQAISQPIAVAAGDEDEAKFGVWATPFVGNSTQKMRSKINGNKANFGGATVGFDGMLNDQVVLGVAYTRAGTKIKQKNDKIGDSSKVKSNIYSIYGLYNLPNNNLFFQAVGSYSDSKIKSYSQRYQPIARNTLATQIANSNYKSRAFTGQIMAGYDYVAPQAVRLTPMVGLRYSKIKDSGYIETGTTLQNLTVKGKSYDLVNGIAGVKLSKDINMDRMILLIPEIYGMLDYGFKNKLPTPDARLQGMSNPFPSSSYKPVKTTWNVGAGVTAKYQMIEYGVNYDVNIASKYFAQQGSLKVRVNF